MLLQIEHWHLGYDQILKDCRSDLQQNQDGLSGGGSGGSVWILCNADVDAMAAARILCYMFRSDGIPYQLRPCASFSSLQKSLSLKRNKREGDENEVEDNNHEDEYSDDEQDDHVRAIILLNLGGSRNLARLLEEQQQQNRMTHTKIYVMDCRRPFHLANIHAGANIVLFGDQTVVDEIPSDGDNLSGNDSTSSESSSEDDDDDDDSSEDEDDEDESEAEFEDSDELSRKEAKQAEVMEKQFSAQQEESDRDYDGDLEDEDNRGNGRGKKSKRRKTAHGDGIDSQDNDDDGDSLQGDAAANEQNQEQEEIEEDVTPIPPEPMLSPRELHRQRRERLRVYYSAGSYFGSPAAFVSYHLSTQLRFGNVGDLLWLACVGVTDAYLHSRIDVAGYTALAMELSDRCDRLYPNDVYQRVSNAVYAEHLVGTDPTATNNNVATTQLRLSENGRILTEKDYRFFLLRHSSLFDSMVHSNYVSTKMKLWTNNGMQKLQELLAKMGYPLTECRQPFAFMKPKLRRRLREMIEIHAEEYGLDNFEFTSFFRITGYNSLISASDVSYAVTALLEVESPATASSNARAVTPTQDGNDGDIGDKADEATAETEEERSTMYAFNVAYDALNANGAASLGPIGAEGSELSSLVNGGNTSSSTGIGAGIRLALNLQHSIIATSVNLVERNAITRLRHFRYAYITCTSEGSHGMKGRAGAPAATRTPPKNQPQESHIFAKPLALTKLAHYLMDMHRENGKWAGTKSRPLVLVAEKPQTSTYMVVGYEYPERHGHFVRNRFGEKFELAAKTMQGSFKFDSFDTNVVEVGGDDVQRFIEQLHYMMDSM